MWYWILNLAVGIWVYLDARKRSMDNSFLWGIGTALIMILIIPFYFAKRPLLAGEIREGGTAWNVIKAFALFWTVLMAIAGIAAMVGASGVVSGATSEAEQAGATLGTAIGIGMIIGLWFIVLVGALVIGLFLKKSSIIERGSDPISP